MSELFDNWTRNRSIPSLGTNSGAERLPFQGWHHFKEAFPPELIRQAVERSTIPVTACFDPFGGSGTTSLAAQFLGLSSTTIEVNPFLADVIRAKLTHYDADALTASFTALHRRSRRVRVDPSRFFAHTPATFIEPGIARRWLFNRTVAKRLASTLTAIEGIAPAPHRRFFRTVLAGTLVEVSNVVISGKGRRYRRNWGERDGSEAFDHLFTQRAGRAISDVHRFSDRPRVDAHVRNGDARRITPQRRHDLVVFSPPYPNSFDYTDVYNLELWMLGYLRTGADNRGLRRATLSSHVQISRRFAAPPEASPTLTRALQRLESKSAALWSPWLPLMIGAYFADLMRVLRRSHATLAPEGQCWLVVGDSQYAGVHVPTARILIELAPSIGFEMRSRRAFRTMRSSAQQGSRTELSETLLVLNKPAASAGRRTRSTARASRRNRD
jgi:hypothetical protein